MTPSGSWATGAPMTPSRRSTRPARISRSPVRDADVMLATIDAVGGHARDGAGSARGRGRARRRRAAITETCWVSWQRSAATPSRLPLGDGRSLAVGARLAYERGRDRIAAPARTRHRVAARMAQARQGPLVPRPAARGGVAADVAAPSPSRPHELGDLLGDDHDLGVLAERLEAERPGRRRSRGALASFRRARELQHEAFVLGARLYAEKPKAFARRRRAYLA